MNTLHRHLKLVRCRSTSIFVRHSQTLAHDFKNAMPAKSSVLFTNFQVLCDTLRKEIKPLQPGEVHDDEHIKHITSLLDNTVINPREWKQFAIFDGKRYTRNLVGYNEKFTMLILCWGKGQTSPIHDHASASCWLKVLSGELVETTYAMPTEEGPMKEVHQAVLSASDECNTGYINDTMSLHRIHNPSPDDFAVSLHVYAPPFEMCNIFQPTSGEAIEVSMVSANAPKNTDVIERAWQGSGNLSLTELVQSLKERDLLSPSQNGMDLHNLFDRLEFTQEDRNMYCARPMFNDFEPIRNLVYLDGKCSLIVTCWNLNQFTPVHSVGPGRSSWAKVMQGSLKIDTCKPGESSSGSSDVYETGAVIHDDHGSQSLLIRMGNPSTESIAVTVHLYTPPFKEIRYIDEDGNFQLKPVVSTLTTGDDCFAPDMRGYLYSNFATFPKLLDRIFESNPEDLRTTLTNALLTVKFNPLEWHQHGVWHPSHFTRILLARTNDYMLVLCCWEPGQFSEVHDHAGSANWIYMLEGTLQDFSYDDKLQVSREGTLGPDSVTYIAGSSVHSCVNASDQRAYSLHLYSPPYLQARAFDLESGASTVVKIPQEVSVL